jgi:hypothetical protein
MYGEAKQLSGSASYGMPASNPAPPPAQATLVGAISNSGVLIDRLVELNNMVESLAIKIGGPWPTDANGGKPRAENPPAMVHLCENIDVAHRLVSQLESSVRAISRSLEG